MRRHGIALPRLLGRLSPIDARSCCGRAIIPGPWLAIGAAGSGVVLAGLMAGARLTIDLAQWGDRLILLGGLAGIGLHHALRAPTSAGQRAARDLIEYFGLTILVCLLGAVASYPLAADSRGFVDPELERVDQFLRFDWLSWYHVVATHPALQWLGGLSYESIFVSPAVLLAYYAWTDRRADARLFIASIWLAAILTLSLFLLAPAEGPLAFLWHGTIPYMPASALYQAQLIPALRHHALHSITLTSLHGLVSIPSFHTTSAALYVAAAWPIGRLRWPAVIVNAAMVMATPVEGTHYLTDMILGLVVALASLAILGTAGSVPGWQGRRATASSASQQMIDQRT